MQHRALTGTLDRARADAAARTVPASLSSELPVRRFGENEVLSHAPGAVDLSRAATGLPMLFNHDRALPVGIVESVRIEGLRLVGILRFGTSAKADEVWRDVQAGVLTNVSVSYSVDATEAMHGGFIVTKWTPHEASVVSVPADPTVGIGRSLPSVRATMSTDFQNRNAIESAANERAASILDLCQRHDLPQLAGELIRSNKTAEQAGAAILDEMARRDHTAGGHRNLSASLNDRGTTGAAAPLALMVDALAARMGAAPAQESGAHSGARGQTSAANPYRHARIADMARELLEVRGIRTADLDPGRLIERAMGVDDFPQLLSAAGNRVLRQSYGMYAGGLKRAFKPSTARDFRTKSLLMLGEAPTLLQVNEHGEFKHGAMAESASSYGLATFGRIISLSRRAMVNDDLDAFGTLTAKLGQAAAEFEAKFLVTLLTSNPTMNDGTALFHANHGNLGTGAGSALQLTSLAAGRKAMRLQKGLDGLTPIDAAPKFLVVPAALEMTAEQLLADVQAAQASDVNVFAGRLDLIVDPRLDAVSATAWYLAADANLIDTIEYAYLEGANGPEVITRDGFEIDGMQFKVREDFGAGAIDWRGMYRSDGA